MHISELIEQYKNRNSGERTPISERHELIGKFLDKLNSERNPNLRKLSAGFIVKKMKESKLESISDLYWFYKYCEDANSFAKCWWWSLKA